MNQNNHASPSTTTYVGWREHILVKKEKPTPTERAFLFVETIRKPLAPPREGKNKSEDNNHEPTNQTKTIFLRRNFAGWKPSIA